MLAVVLGATIADGDQSGHRITLAEALLKGTAVVERKDIELGILGTVETLRSALEIGSEPPPPKGGATPLARAV